MIVPVAVMILTLPNRRRYLARALECLKQQTYKDSPIYPILNRAREGVPIGTLRNEACDVAYKLGAGAMIHWDDDDWSGPERIASQLRDLQKPYVRACGYNTMLFWDSVKGEAWEYHNPHPQYVLGTSFCYWLSTWRDRPFADLQTGEDEEWRKAVRPHATNGRQRLIIAEIHGGNTTSHVEPEAEEWKRVEEMDGFCRERMRVCDRP